MARGIKAEINPGSPGRVRCHHGDVTVGAKLEQIGGLPTARIEDGPRRVGLPPVAGVMPVVGRPAVGAPVRPFPLRDSSPTPRLPDRLLSHHPPSTRPCLHVSKPRGLRPPHFRLMCPLELPGFESNTPGALTEVPQVGVTAEAGEIAFLRCDYEPAQAHRRVGL
jgi:hypothetical protein